MMLLFPRALDDFDELLWELPLRDPSTAEAMKSQIGVLLGVLDQYALEMKNLSLAFFFSKEASADFVLFTPFSIISVSWNSYR
jgi:hypothetical protein